MCKIVLRIIKAASNMIATKIRICNVHITNTALTDLNLLCWSIVRKTNLMSANDTI